ncbi:hypothetical protein CDD81_7492 [Ophiocordyceps australis]|uniref:Uncharacterized protein n=1 Tax=Ophiocordyceps australis TaxID=1399860 RepID=A0A2C5YCJ6_9HYPO|nr:hypothetical protein CDD81_7492 [Ophiocordyceps australis]
MKPYNNSPRKLLMLVVALLSVVAVANVEKVVFTGPAPVGKSLAEAVLSHVDIAALAPHWPWMRSNLSRVFPMNNAKGHPSWLLLDGLQHGQKYEVRVCWAAIEPTKFEFDVYELGHVWESQELGQSLAQYAVQGQPDAAVFSHQEQTSALLFRVEAAADYFSHNVELMTYPPPVLVDIILDPYLLGVFPRSLVPTACYLIIVAFMTYLAARCIISTLQSVATSIEGQPKKQD